jgi:protein gp37
LKQTPAAVRVVSYEPALGGVDWSGWEFLDWMICGYESGPQARPGHPDWARHARDFCQTHSIPFFFKQWGEWTPYAQVAFSHPWRPAPPRVIVHPSGSITTHRDINVTSGPGAVMYRVGKRRAGRLLDGREWNEMPTRRQP